MIRGEAATHSVTQITAEAQTLPTWLAAAFRDRLGTALRFRTEFRTFWWSYPRLWDAAHRAAGLYAAHGLRRGDRVLIWGPNSPAWAAALLGCFLSGVVAVPIDFRSRPDFVQRVWRETDASLLLRTRYKPDPGLPVPSIYLEELEWRLAEATPVPLPSLAPADMAEILYTSGTTGEPKGTILTHENLVSELRALLPVVPESRLTLLSILPLSHIFEQEIGFLLPLSIGATVVYLETVKPSAIADALRMQAITAMVVVPRFLQLLRDQLRRRLPEALAGVPDALAALGLSLPPGLSRSLSWPVRQALAPDLEFLVCGGAPLDPDLERFWDGLGVPVLQGYGLTETSSAVTLNDLTHRRIGTVGRVLPNQVVRLGPEDEVQVQGPNVTPGYYDNPEQTRAAFADGWFRTGDVGRFDPDGYLILRGRLKDVIVTSAGVNVYPEDVEAVLNRLLGVRESAVVEWHGHVHAVLLLTPEAEPRAREIVAEANRHLDSAQQILGYTVWPGHDLPRTATGKVRKGEVLAALGQIEAHRPVALPTPRGLVPTLIAQVSHRQPAEVRPSDALGPDLQLGSIDRMELLALVESELSVDLDESAVTANTTVGELERMVQERRAAVSRESFPRWSRWPVVQAVRSLLQRWVVFPFVRHFVDLDVRGCEHLADLRGPALFVANHTSRLDVPVLLMALPDRERRRLAPAVRAEFFEAPGRPLKAFLLGLLFDLVALAFDAFKIPQYRGFRPSLRYAGELVDHGWSILVFPEGRQTTTGEMGAFKEGVGVMVSALRVPVVPVRLRGLFEIASGAELIPRRHGRASVTFGRPLVFRDESYQEIAERIEAAVRAL